ncbi:MAG: ATP-binding protein [Saprospiraceae bacterium]
MILLHPIPIYAQAPEFTVRHFDRDDGLLYDKFNAFISSDSRGFTWIGSSHGVFRMDGSTFKHYPIPASSGFEDFVQSQCFEDKNGLLWFSGVDGLHVYDYTVDTLRSIRLDSTLMPSHEVYHAFHYDEERHDLLISNGSQIARVDLATETIEGTPQPSRSMRFTSMTNSFFLGMPWLKSPGLELLTWTNDSTLHRVDSKVEIVKRATIYAACFSESEKKSAWLGSNEGLLHFDYRADTLIAKYKLPKTQSQLLWSISLQGDYIFAASNDDGLLVFDHVQKKWFGQVYRGVNEEDKPRSIHHSPDGTLWTMQAKGGIDALIPASPNLKVLRNTEGKPLNVRTFYRGTSNELWVGTAAGTISSYGQTQSIATLKNLSNLAKSRWAASSTQLPNGRHLIAVRDQLYQSTETGDWKVIFSDQSFIYSTHYNQELDAVIITTKNGIHKLKGVNTYQYQGGYSDGPWLRPLFYLDGTRYIDGEKGTYTYVLDLKGDEINKIDSIPVGGSVQSIATAPDGSVWIGTIRGLFHAQKDTTTKTWEVSAPLKDDRIFYGLHVDETGVLYASTDKGLNVRNTEGEWQTWQTLDGLPSNEGVIIAPIIDAAGSIWMATEKGVIGLSKSQSSEKKNRLKNYFSDLWINERPDLRIRDMLKGDPLELNYSENTIDVGVGTLGFIDGVKSPIEYQLSPYQEGWAELRSGSVLRFTKVPPGTYTLRIRMKDEGESKRPPLTASLFIEAPYWQTWWFKLSALAGILGLGFGIAHVINRRKLAQAKQQIQQVELVAKERDRIARELHDDLGGDLSNILFLSEGTSPISEEDLRTKISQLSRASLDHMRDIIWALQTEELSLFALFNKLNEHGYMLCDPRGFNFRTHIYGEELMLKVKAGMNLRRNLILIGKEAITNAVRHSAGTQVDVSGRMDYKDEFILTISDNGSGFNPSKAVHGNGTINMKKRVNQLNGTFNLITKHDDGTTITITIPLDNSKVGGA